MEHSQIQLVQITDYRKTESKNSNSIHYKHIRQQLTTCWPQNFKPQIKYIVKKKRKKKKYLEKYYIIIITKNEWIVVLFLRQILYSFFWRGDIYDWRDLLKYCTGIPTTMGKNAKKSAIYDNLLPFNARSSKNLSNNSFIPFGGLFWI